MPFTFCVHVHLFTYYLFLICDGKLITVVLSTCNRGFHSGKQLIFDLNKNFFIVLVWFPQHTCRSAINAISWHALFWSPYTFYWKHYWIVCVILPVGLHVEESLKVCWNILCSKWFDCWPGVLITDKRLVKQEAESVRDFSIQTQASELGYSFTSFTSHAVKVHFVDRILLRLTKVPNGFTWDWVKLNYFSRFTINVFALPF